MPTSKLDCGGRFLIQLRVRGRERAQTWDRYFVDLGSGSTVDIRAAHIQRPEKQIRFCTKFLIAALLLIGAASTASAQYLPYNGCSSLRERGYYGTPTGGGPQYGYGGGDQYGYGPGYSYARQAPSCNSRGTRRVGAQRGRTAHEN